MRKTIQEQIEVMQHYANGGDIEFMHLHGNKEEWQLKIDVATGFDWSCKDYRIKKQKKTITIEKWLCEYNGCEELKGSKRFFIIEKAFPFEVAGKKIKRLECYEVELNEK